MALTNTQLRSLLKAALHQDGTYSDPDDLNTFLTIGQEIIVRDSPHTLGAKATTLATTASDQDYTLASDFFQMRSMWLPAASQKINPMGHERWVAEVEALATIPTGSPEFYIVYGYETATPAWGIRFYPTPDAVYTVKYFYYWLPTAITGSVTSAISSIGFGDLLLEAAIMAARARNDPEGRLESTAAYDRLMRDYRTFSPQGPDYTPALASHYNPATGGSTLRLPPESPDL